MAAPALIKEIPPQVVNEQAAYGPFLLRDYFLIDDSPSEVQFTACLIDGSGLPKGMICTADGALTGIPAIGTEGNYEILLTAENEEGATETRFTFMIKPSIAGGIRTDYIDQLKSQVWEALGQNLPIPDLSEMLERAVTPLDVYYLLERWGTLTIWDAYNLEPAGEKKLLQLEGTSIHFNVYDRGSCLVACPKDLFSHERTLLDGLQTAKVMAGEIYKRGWTIEMAGFDKYTRAAWVEIQHLVDQYGKPLEIVNYTPSAEDLKIYSAEALGARLTAGPE